MALYLKKFGSGLATLGVIWFALAFFASPAWAQTAVLDVEKTGNPNIVESGEQITYTITVDNTGDADAAGVTLEDILPASVRFVSAETEGGACTQSDGTVTCNLNPIGPDEPPTTVTIVVRAGASGSITNSATVTTTTGTPDTDTADTTVVPNLEITKLDDPDPVSTEDLLLYTLRIENLGGVLRTT